MKIAIIRPFPGVVPLQPGKIGIAQCPHDMRILRLRPKCFGAGLHTGRNRPVIQPIKGNALPESVKPAVLSNHRFPAFSADPDCRGSPAGRICNGHAAQRDPAGGIGKHQGQNRLFTDPDAIKYGIFDRQANADFRRPPCQQFAAGSTDAPAEIAKPAAPQRIFRHRHIGHRIGKTADKIGQTEEQPGMIHHDPLEQRPRSGQLNKAVAVVQIVEIGQPDIRERDVSDDSAIRTRLGEVVQRMPARSTVNQVSENQARLAARCPQVAEPDIARGKAVKDQCPDLRLGQIDHAAVECSRQYGFSLPARRILLRAGLAVKGTVRRDADPLTEKRNRSADSETVHKVLSRREKQGRTPRQLRQAGELFGRGGVCVIRRLLSSGKNVNAGAYRPNGFAEPEAVRQNSVRSALHRNISFRK